MAAPGARSTRARARARRRAELAVVAAATVALLAWLVAGGPWYLFLLAGLLGVALVVNLVAHVGRRGPEDVALWPGQLREATATRDVVSVPATWAPSRRAPERARHDGRLQFADGRLTFVVTAGPEPGSRWLGAGRDPGPDLRGTSLLDAELWELRLGPPPSWRRPQLVVAVGDRSHVVDLAPGWDLTVGVSHLVARDWWDQLRELGVAEGGPPRPAA